MHTLVTILGRPPYDKENKTYKETIYDIEGYENSSPSRYFCLKIHDHTKPDKLVILGTTGSLWGNFLEYALEQNKVSKDQAIQQLIIKLDNDSKEDKTQQKDLNQAAEILSHTLNCKCELHLIPYGRSSEEQTETLRIMMGFFNNYDKATIDVTHGLRHLPILMQQSALLLQSLKNVTISNIYYGALDLSKDGKTPVMELKGLLAIDRWSKAFHRYEQDGNYTAFEEPLKHENLNDTALTALKEAAYYERTFNLTDAGNQLEVVKNHLPDKFDGVGGFFTERFKEHITWSSNESLQQRQAKLAHFYLNNGEFVRACIFGLESFITSLLEPNEYDQEHNFQTRKDAADEFKNYYHSRAKNRKNLKSEFMQLSRIRNALAHGTESNNKTAEIMENSIRLNKELNRLFKRLGINP